jgi:hypothetical protein
VLRHLVSAIRARWPAVDIVIRGDGHDARPEAMRWLECHGVGAVFGRAVELEGTLGDVQPDGRDARRHDVAPRIARRRSSLRR